MRLFFVFIFISNFFTAPVAAQKRVHLIREYPMHFIYKDSINAFFSDQYFLQEEECAGIIRRGHFNNFLYKYTGAFEDVLKTNPRRIVAKGFYTQEGKKEGAFKLWYLNGKMQAEGNFKNNKLSGLWDLYYPSGKLKVTMHINDGDVRIVNAWNERGKQTLKDGKGSFDLDLGALTWTGKVNNGLPNEKWTVHFTFREQKKTMATEIFENNVFKYGQNATGIYRDSSHIHFLDAVALPFLNAETLAMSAPCEGVYIHKIVFAYFKKGYKEFIDEISKRLNPVLKKMDTVTFFNPVDLEFNILETGKIMPGTVTGDTKMHALLSDALKNLPALIPASVNDKVIEQKMIISIWHHQQQFAFSYRHKPLLIYDEERKKFISIP